MAILNKTEFCEVMNNLKQTDECIDILNNVFKTHNKDIKIYSTLYEFTDILKVLKIMFNDDEIIDYWVYDLNYGEKYSDGCITEKDNTEIVLKTAEDLYEYLIKEMVNNEDKLS
jgi:hypothetical protein